MLELVGRLALGDTMVLVCVPGLGGRRGQVWAQGLDGKREQVYALGLDGRLEQVCVLEVDGKGLACVLEVDGKGLACEREQGDRQVLACELELGLHNPRRIHQQYTQHSDQQYISHFDVFHQEVALSNAQILQHHQNLLRLQS